MSADDTTPHTLRLHGDWQVRPLMNGQPLAASLADEWCSLPECTHLQLALYPDRPYWGDHLRAINEQPWLYCRTLTVPPDATYERARLRFEAVDYFATVRLNGHAVGQHEGHFAPFEFDVTEYLRPGDNNQLEVEVSAPWDRPNPTGNYPMDHVIRGLVKGLYEHGEGVIPPNVNPLGIWRPVWLLLDDGLSLDHMRIRTDLDGTVDVRLTITNASNQPWQGKLALNVEADNHDGPGTDNTLAVQLPPGTSEVIERLHIPDARLWWPWDHGDPNLYQLTATLGDEAGRVFDTQADTFGVRTVELERAPDSFTYRVNDRPIYVRGSSYMPGLYLSACDRPQLAQDIELARAANLNLLRVHVHVSPPDVYDLCDRQGMLIWQDFELNWLQATSPDFEQRARAMQRDMIDLLGNHPSIITWACHNEPTLILARRGNYEQSPDPILYDDACQQDPTRPVFICSGQMEHDWTRSGDAHVYYGAFWTANYTDVHQHQYRMCTEFGFEAPAALATLHTQPEVWARLDHLDGQIDDLWAYQAELIQYYVEHFRRQRVTGGAGYIHFWLADLVPQVGCGVLDSDRRAKQGYTALARASQPLQVSLEHDGRRPLALWLFNDTLTAYAETEVGWTVYDEDQRVMTADSVPVAIAANTTRRIMSVDWPVNCDHIELVIRDAQGQQLAHNAYHRPFQPLRRPRGYPWKFDPYLGTKVFDRPGASSLTDQSDNPLVNLVPVAVREGMVAWILRQRFPVWLASTIAQVADRLNPA